MPTRVGCFLDTNILLYAALGKTDEPKKHSVSRELIAAWEFGISTQVLAEFFVNVQRKSSRPLTAAEAVSWISELEARPCIEIDRSLFWSATEFSQRYRISYWDAAILVAAERLEAPVVFTEDLNHEQTYGSVQVINPFRASAYG